MKAPKSPHLENYTKIFSAASRTNDADRCMIAPHPALKKKLKAEMDKIRKFALKSGLESKIKFEDLKRPGLNDGLIYPGNTFPLGTTVALVKRARIQKAPLRGKVRIIIVLASFSDKKMKKTKKHFEDLFFSVGVVKTGSVREYFREVTNDLIDIVGEVVGPYKLPKTLATYAHDSSGMSEKSPNARTMARDAAQLANASVNFAQYDNDGDNFVDAYIVIHAGTGAETTNNPNDIWSHKWVLEKGSYKADGTTKVYSYLTVPEDCNLGVCAHELGHLLFGFPDLYDTDASSEGVGDWCLMGGGSWNNDGLTPAHPSAWCKCNQGWVDCEVPTSNLKKVKIADVKTGNKVYRLWKDGTIGNEYFLVENRQKKLFDKFIPASGLLVWHIDDSIEENADEAHYKVALVQADGNKDLEIGNNRGDSGDCFPGSGKKTTFNKTSTPNSMSYARIDTQVEIKNITKSGASIIADLNVT